MNTTSKISHNNLISSSLPSFEKALTTSLELALKNTLQELFDKAENADTNQRETELFEQYNYLMQTRSKLLGTLVSVTQSMPDEITEQISLGSDSINLSIVEEEELEISLAFTQLEAVLDIRFTQYLFALEKRLKILFASKNISKTNMPYGIASICWIYSQTLDLNDANISTKTAIIGFLKKHLTEHLLQVYKIIDAKFVSAGILPNIKVIKKSNPSPQKTSNQPVAGQTPQSATPDKDFGGASAINPNQPELTATHNSLNQVAENKGANKIQMQSSEIVKSIFDLMNIERSASEPEVQASSIKNNVMDKTLDNLSKVTSVAAGSTEIDKLKEMIIDNVRNETGVYYPRLNKTQQNTLDVMGMFYEQVKSDSSIDNNMLSSLNAINIPLIRTAINDASFFDDEEHPAREYLERIIYASKKWHGTSVVKTLHKFSSNLASDFDGTTKSFDAANDDLESYLRLTDRRAKKAEEKWVSAAKGKEKMEISRHKVEEVVENISQNAVPAFVKNVIKYVIQDSLTLSLLRHGENSDEWHKNINTSSTIAKMANPELIKDLTPKQKIESLHHLDQTMDELGFSKNDRSNTINNIKECANAAMAKTLDENIELKNVATINKEKKNVKKAGSTTIEQLRELTNAEKTELSKIRLLPYGTIFDFITNQQRNKIRRKLSWFSPVSNKALFVSLLGKTPYEKSLNAIAIDIVRKNILIVKEEKKKYFDNVLSSIFKKLKALKN